MWGTQSDRSHKRGGSRFTPTHVGNTTSVIDPGPEPAVHPHACGEHWLAMTVQIDAAGSPPRMWGTHDRPTLGLSPPRFTPTHVGNTHWSPPAPVGHAVHPHACGEHELNFFVSLSTPGSPPRMWGTLAHFVSPFVCWRFTPTHVGNTWEHTSSYVMRPVHPHACGEHQTGTAV